MFKTICRYYVVENQGHSRLEIHKRSFEVVLEKTVAVSVSAFDSLFLLFWLKKQDLVVWICSCFRNKCFNVNNFRKILKSSVKFAFYELVTTFSKRQSTWQGFLDICRRSSYFAILKFHSNSFSIIVFTRQWFN